MKFLATLLTGLVALLLTKYKFGVIAILLSLLSGCATVKSSPNSSCHFDVQSSALILVGSTNEKMKTCVDKIDLSSLDTVRIDSTGGRTDYAIEIADKLAIFKPKIIVDGECVSSCHNYFLPISRSVFVTEGSEILMHGSIDTGFANMSSGGDAGLKEKFMDIVRAQEAFENRHVIHPGWLMKRTPQDYENNSFGSYIDGTFERFGSNRKVKLFMVEKEFFESCLPDVKITFEGTSNAQRMYKDKMFRRRKLKRNIVPTGTMKCKPA